MEETIGGIMNFEEWWNRSCDIDELMNNTKKSIAKRIWDYQQKEIDKITKITTDFVGVKLKQITQLKEELKDTRRELLIQVGMSSGLYEVSGHLEKENKKLKEELKKEKEVSGYFHDEAVEFREELKKEQKRKNHYKELANIAIRLNKDKKERIIEER